MEKKGGGGGQENKRDSAESNFKLKRWHERYGHLNYEDLKKLCANNMVFGLDCLKK